VQDEREKNKERALFMCFAAFVREPLVWKREEEVELLIYYFRREWKQLVAFTRYFTCRGK
jgi:hypothetical protein